MFASFILARYRQELILLFFLFYLCFPTWLIKCFNVTNLNTFSIFLDIVYAPWRVHLTEGFYLVQLLMHNVQCAICKQHKAHAFPFCLTGQILLQLNVPCTALCQALGVSCYQRRARRHSSCFNTAPYVPVDPTQLTW